MTKLWIPFGLSVALLASTGCSYSSTRPGPTSQANIRQYNRVQSNAPLRRSSQRPSATMVRNDYYPHLQSTPRIGTSYPTQTSFAPSHNNAYGHHRECITRVRNNTWVLIHGQEFGSRVNIRPGPGFNHYDGHYTLVGDSAKVIGKRGNWYNTRFAETLHEGWLHCSVVDQPDF